MDVFFGAVITTYLFMGIIGFLLFAFWVWMLVDCLNNKTFVGNEKTVWVIVIVLTNGVGALIYLFSKLINSELQKKEIIVSWIFFTLILFVGIMFASFLYSTPRMINDGFNAEFARINKSIQKTINHNATNNTYGRRSPVNKTRTYRTNKAKVTNSKRDTSKKEYEISDIKISSNDANKITNAKTVTRIQPKFNKGKYIELGRWSNRKLPGKSTVVILDFGNELILIEHFDDGMQIEQPLTKKRINDSNQKYRFVGKNTEDNYVVDRTGNLIVSDSMGLKGNYKPI